jgi:hypothetical protein
MFRTSDWDDLDRENTHLLFELVVYVNQAEKAEEYTCGWGHTPISNADKDISKMKISLHAGEPQGSHNIDCEDVGKKGGLMNTMRGMFNSGKTENKSELTISIRP